MARLPSAGHGQSHPAHRAWGSWPPLPWWGLGHSPAKEWRRPPCSAATMAALVVLLVFLFSASVVQGEEAGVLAGANKGGKGVSAAGGNESKWEVKLPFNTDLADAKYMIRLAAATGADRVLNWTGADPCHNDWAGINCDGFGKVIGINASTQGLAGWVPSTEGDGALSSLVDLDLSNNELTGPLPDLNLPMLEHLYLDGNKFTSMPPRFFSNMSKAKIISISNTSSLGDWTLPDLSELKELQKFRARNSSIVGNLVLGNINTLGDLDLAENRLTGTVPATFSSQEMQDLDLSSNCLNGSISFLQSLPGVQFIQLSNNNFSGPLPDFDEHNLPQVFSVAHNRLTGLLPAWASLPQFLAFGTAVYLSGNMLQGPVPVFAIAGQNQVQTDVAEAARTGSFCRLDPGPCDPEVDALLSIAMALHFPVSLAESWRRNDPCAGWVGVHCAPDKTNGRRVTGINLSRMFLNGTIHPAFANLKSLETILLAGNNISGTIPPALTQLQSLRLLDVSDNVLNGSVPKFGRGVEVWAEGNPGLNISSVSAPSMSEQTHFTVIFVVVAVLLLAV